MGKVNNIQEEFSLRDMEIAREVTSTYNCGKSRIALKAPNQVYGVHRCLTKEHKSGFALMEAMTLKLYYAVQVWCKAALISDDNPSDLQYYWWLHWVDTNQPFRKLEYINFHRDITVEQLLQCFWNLLEKIANSGEIQVSEGYQLSRKEGYKEPYIVCDVVLDAETGREIHEKVDDVYTYPYNRELRTYRWDDIKDFFYEMTLDQLRLTMPEELHNHTRLDDDLLKACDDWDIDAIKKTLQQGANINCLDKLGKSVLQNAVDYYKDHNILLDNDYSQDELKKIQMDNEQRCKEIVDLLISYGADINLFGFDGMPPLICAYYQKSPEMIKFLLERGASPNANCYLQDNQYWPLLKNIRSTILAVIDEDLSEEYDDIEREIEKLVRDAGGRQFVFGFTPWDYENVNKYVVQILPSYTEDNGVFYDNSGWKIGSTEQIIIEDRDGNQTSIKLEKCSERLAQWNMDFQTNRKNKQYDWLSWKERGYELACQVAKQLPNDVALFYLYNNDKVVRTYSEPDKLYLEREGDPIRIK